MGTTETHSVLPRHDGGACDLIITTSGERGPGVVFVCSAYGVNEELRTTMARYSAAGYVCAAPDMFSHCSVPGPLEQTEENRPKWRARIADYDFAVGMNLVKQTMDALRARPDCSGTIAVAGWCFGGEFAFMAPLEVNAAAGIAFHGVGIGKHLDRANAIMAPLSLHFGAEDPLTPPDEVASIEAAFRGRGDVGVYSYPGAKHGFTQADGAGYDPSAAKAAEERALATLAALK